MEIISSIIYLICVLHLIHAGCHVCKPLKLQVHLGVCLHLDVDGCIMVYARIWVDLHRCANIDPDQLFSSMASSSSSGPPAPPPRDLVSSLEGVKHKRLDGLGKRLLQLIPSRKATLLLTSWTDGRGDICQPLLYSRLLQLLQQMGVIMPTSCFSASWVHLASTRITCTRSSAANSGQALLRSPSMRSVYGKKSRANLRSK